MNLKQSLLGLVKKNDFSIIIFFVDINSKFSMDNCTHHFENTLTSSSHANFRLAIFSLSNLFTFFLGKGKRSKS